MSFIGKNKREEVQQQMRKTWMMAPVFVAMPSRELMHRMVLRATQKKVKEEMAKFNNSKK